MNIKYLTDKINISPESELDDGFLNLQLVSAENNNKVSFTRYLLRMPNGSHITKLG